MSTLKVMTIVGTRPEIIRLSRTLARFDATFHHTLVHTGQNHDRQLNEVFFEELDLRPPDHHLGVDMSTLGRALGGIITATERILLEERPDAVVVLGDTNSSIATVMARRMRVPVYHLEAGNRSYDANVPEEVNRRLVDHIADFNLVYTEHARRNLLAEGLPSRRIALTGSPMREVLDYYAPRIDASQALVELGLDPHGFLLASAHREETVDDPARLAMLVETLETAGRRLGLPVLVSTHPRTRARLDGSEGAGGGDSFESTSALRWHPPFGFLDYVHLQRSAYCVLSDSGTISEESAILGFPAVTLRDAIERPEALEAGSVIATGLNPSVVGEAIAQVRAQYDAGDVPPPPPEYSITNYSQRIVNFIRSTVHVHRTWAGIHRPPWPVL